MNTMPDVRNHAHADSLLDDYVTGTLSAPDLAWMDEHIATCAICQAELPLLLEASFALPFAVDDPPVEMSDDVWDRIAKSIDAERQENSTITEVVPTQAARSTTIDPTLTWPVNTNDQSFKPLDLDDIDTTTFRRKTSRSRSSDAYKWVALAAAAIVILGLGAFFARDRLWWDTSDNDPQSIAMVDADGNPIDSSVASLEYLPGDRRLVLEMEEMPAAPDGQIYQAWLIAGEEPVPIGTVDPAVGAFEHEVDMDEFDAFAITVEPGPDGSERPTSDPVVVASLAPES